MTISDKIALPLITCLYFAALFVRKTRKFSITIHKITDTPNNMNFQTVLVPISTTTHPPFTPCMGQAGMPTSKTGMPMGMLTGMCRPALPHPFTLMHPQNLEEPRPSTQSWSRVNTSNPWMRSSTPIRGICQPQLVTNPLPQTQDPITAEVWVGLVGLNYWGSNTNISTHSPIIILAAWADLVGLWWPPEPPWWAAK